MAKITRPAPQEPGPRQKKSKRQPPPGPRKLVTPDDGGYSRNAVRLVHERNLAVMAPHLGRRARILEVGCGDGALAWRLMERGHRVTAIDVSTNAIRKARTRGVPALLADIMEFESDPFDVVVFSRSLHHIPNAAGAIKRAHALTVPGGKLILDEFGVNRIDRETAVWFYDLMDPLVAWGAMEVPEHWRHPHADSLQRWKSQHSHKHRLHTDAQMIRAVDRHFRPILTERTPYLYRYFCDNLGTGSTAVAVGRWIMEREREHIAKGRLVAIGLQLVAQRR